MISEERIQQECRTFLWNNYPSSRGFFFHVPNGEKRDPMTGKKLKEMGVLKGVPDCIYYHPTKQGFKVFHFEFKEPNSGSLSKHQEAIINLYNSVDPNTAFVVDNIEDFKSIINKIHLDYPPYLSEQSKNHQRQYLISLLKK